MKQLELFKKEAVALAKSFFPPDQVIDYEPPRVGFFSEIIDKLFKASLYQDEDRQPQIKLVYIEAKRLDEFASFARNHFQYFSFAEYLELSSKILAKTSFLVDYRRSFLCVTCGKSKKSSLQVCGIFHIGSGFERFMHLETGIADLPPDAIFFASDAPGRIHIAYGFTPLVGFDKGEIVRAHNTKASHSLCKNPYFRAAFSPVIQKFFRERKNTLDNPYPKMKLRDLYMEKLLLFGKRLLLQAQKHSHGSAVFFVKSADSIPAGTVKGSRPLTVQPGLIHWIKLFFSAWEIYLCHDLKPESEKDKNYKYRLQHDISMYKAKINDTLDFFGSLTQVDGALILTTSFELVTYGAEILLTESAGLQVKEKMPNARTEKIDINQFGTRHRSAARFIHSIPGTIGFIMSQDGGLKLIAHKKNEVLIYPDIDKLENEFFLGI